MVTKMKIVNSASKALLSVIRKDLVRPLSTSKPSKPAAPIEITAHTSKNILSKYKSILMDCDGVIWKMDHVTPINGTDWAINHIVRQGIKVLYVTNNSIESRKVYVDKLANHGIETSIENVFNTAYSSAVYLKDFCENSGSTYVIGSEGMAHELSLMGINHFGIGPDSEAPSYDPAKLLKLTFRDDITTVLVGFDEHFNYVKLFKAASYLTNPQCAFVATNSIEIGKLIASNRQQPSTGVLVSAVSLAASREPVVVGKPHLHMFKCICSRHPDIEVDRTLVIGDNLRADIGMANNIGADSLLVLTGKHSIQDVEKFGIFPTYYASSLTVLKGS